jgi:hypothetical protein
MKSTNVTAVKDVKLTETYAVDADGIERTTTTASRRVSGRTLSFQRVKVNTGDGFKTLYVRKVTGGNKKFKLFDFFTWIKLAYQVEKSFQKPLTD